MPKHDAPNTAPAVPPPPAPCVSRAAQLRERRNVSAIFVKTRRCRFYPMGICTRGESCLFAHSEEERKALPNLTCTKLCPKLGSCDDPYCRFAHGMDELRKLGQKKKFPDSTCTKLCPKLGSCDDPYCRNVHGMDDLRKLGQEKKFPNLTCTKLCPKLGSGDDPYYRFAHGMDELRKLGQNGNAAHAEECAEVPPNASGPLGKSNKFNASAFSSLDSTALGSEDFEALSEAWSSSAGTEPSSPALPIPSTTVETSTDTSGSHQSAAVATPIDARCGHGGPAAFTRTKMCKFYLSGHCVKQDKCTFAHRECDLRPVPDKSRKAMCPTLMSLGRCQIEGCTYTHNRERLGRSRVRAARQPHSAAVQGTNLPMHQAKEGQALQEAQPATCVPVPFHGYVPSSQGGTLPQQPQMASMFAVPIRPLMMVPHPHMPQPVLQPFGLSLSVAQAPAQIQLSSAMLSCGQQQQTLPVQQQHYNSQQEQHVDHCTQKKASAQNLARLALPWRERKQLLSTLPSQLQHQQQQQQHVQQQQADSEGQGQSPPVPHPGSLGCQPRFAGAQASDLDAFCLADSKSTGELSPRSRSAWPGKEAPSSESASHATIDEHDEDKDEGAEQNALRWADMLDEEEFTGEDECFRNASLHMRSF